MTEITSIPCTSCKSTGQVINQFTKDYDTCRACRGEGEIFPCDTFTSRRPPAMRNRPCDNCHATERQHELLAELKEIRKVNA